MAKKIYSTRQAADKYAKTVGGKVTQANGKFVVMTTTNSNATRRQQNATSTPKKPTTLQKARAATQGVRTRARVLTGAGRLDGPNTSKAALARESARVAAAKVKKLTETDPATIPKAISNAASGAASSAKKSVKRTAKRGVGAVRTGIATLKTKRFKAKRDKAARNLTKGSMGGKGKSYSQLTSKQKVAMGGGRRGPSETKRTTSQSIGVAKRSVKKAATTAGTTARSWGSAAQKAAIRKLAEFNRGRKRVGSAISRANVRRKRKSLPKVTSMGR